MNLSIRNDYASLKNLPNLADLAQAGRAGSLHSLRSYTTAPPDGGVDAKTTASIQSTMKEQFAAKAQDPRAFHDLMAKVYGAGYDQNKAEALRQKALAGDFSWLPPVRLLDAETLHGANGAYDAQNGVVYINADLAAKNPKLAASTYVEEAGAHLDTMLNRADSAGDEGELLRRVMGGEQLSAQEIASIRSENDHGTIVVDGKEVAVEFWNPIKSVVNGVKAAAGAIKQAVTTGAKKASGAFFGAVGGIAGTINSVVDGIKDTGKTALGGLKKMTVGFVKNLAKGDIEGAFTSVFQGARDLTFGTTKAITTMAVNNIAEMLKIPTHFLPGSVGQKVRDGIDTARDVASGIARGISEVLARIVDLGAIPPLKAFGRLSASLVDLATLDFKGAAGNFLGTFTNVPGDFKDGFAGIVAPGVAD